MSDNAPPPPPYGQQPPGPPPYGYGQPYPFRPPNHESAVIVMVLGILGVVTCQVLSPFAWVMGNRVVREIDASGGRLGGRDLANVGRICGIIGTVLLGLSAVFFVLFLGLFAVGAGSSFLFQT